jgi:hypothetical protein
LGGIVVKENIMSENEARMLVSKITSTKYMNTSENLSFKFQLVSLSDDLGEKIISIIDPLWNSWPGIAEDVVKSVFLKFNSKKCFRILLNRLRRATSKDAGTVHGVLNAFYKYSAINRDTTAALAIRAIYAISIMPQSHFRSATMAGDDPVKNAQFYIQELSKENDPFVQSSLAKMQSRNQWWLAAWKSGTE